MTGFCTFLTTSMPDINDITLSNTNAFLSMMPVDSSALFISQLDQLNRSENSFKYITRLHGRLFKEYPEYREKFYDPISKAGEKRL